MAYTRVTANELAGYQPAMDYRLSGSFGIIGGANFSWDASGVRSDFASRLVSTNQQISNYGDHVQSYKVGDGYHIVAKNQVWRFVPTTPGAREGTWVFVTALDSVQTIDYATIPEHLRHFTSFNMAGKTYVNSWNNGCYRVDPVTHVYTRLTSGTVPGFPTDADPIYAVAETSGRALYMTETAILWSGPAQPEDLVPTIGGAGQQVIAQFVSGEPRTLLRVSRGVLIWTTSGALAGEFIGAPLVFRWFQSNVDVMPLNQAALVQMPDGSTMALTRLGLYMIVDLGTPKIHSPLFGEFFREYVRAKRMEDATLWYSQSDNKLFVAMRQTGSQFTETFCLDVSLDKWGILNVNHMGLILYSPIRTQLGYVSLDGIASYFLPVTDPRKNIERESEPGTFRGLNSFVTIGYFRAENMLNGAEGLQAMTGLAIYRSNVVAGQADEDVDEGLITDPSFTVFDEGETVDDPYDSFDEGQFYEGNEAQGYRVNFLSDFNGFDVVTQIDYSERPAHLANRGLDFDWWTGDIVGQYLSVSIVASEPGEYFRIHALGATHAYVGEI